MTNVNLYARKDAKNNDPYDTFFKALQQQPIGG